MIVLFVAEDAIVCIPRLEGGRGVFCKEFGEKRTADTVEFTTADTVGGFTTCNFSP
jgi:hypothetical protein